MSALDGKIAGPALDENDLARLGVLDLDVFADSVAFDESSDQEPSSETLVARPKKPKARLPEIYEDTNIRTMVDLAEVALASAGAEVYHRGGELVRVVQVGGRPRIQPLSLATLNQRSGPVLARLALIVLRHAQELRTAQDPHTTMRSLAASVGDLLQQVLDQSGRTVVFRYMLEIVELDPSEGEEILVRALPGQVKEDVVTAADQLRAEGELRALRRVLLRQLREKFTEVSVAAEERVAKATADELDEWTTRVVKVDTVDAVFGSSGQG